MLRKPRYVKLTLQGQIVETRPELAFLTSKEQVSFSRLLKILESARNHKRVRGLLLIIKDLQIGWSEIQEIHQELDRLHSAGKFSVAWIQSGSNKHYYLASGAQRVFIPPSGSVELIGLRMEIFFFKHLLAYLGIEPELFSLGDYKSAGEIFTREEMSEANRTMLESILSDLQQQISTKIGSARRVDLDQVGQWIDNGPYTARQALDANLVDGVCYEDEVEERLKEEEPESTALSAAALDPREGFLKRLFTFYRPQVALIAADGVLATGQSRRQGGNYPIVGSDTLVQFLRDARRRRRTKAIVIRVNSPGGSALASDLVWRQIDLTNQRKPVIVSFGNVAASGGYYVATAGRSILAMPASLTGSIGVIHGKFNIQRLLARLGVTVDWLETGKRAGYSSLTRPFSEEEKERIRAHMKEFYEELFLKKVASSRHKSIDEVRGLAEGRVWTGSQSLSNGLSDEIGGLLDAVQKARREAGIPDGKKIRLIQHYKRRSLRDLLPFSLPDSFRNEILALMPDYIEIH